MHTTDRRKAFKNQVLCLLNFDGKKQQQKNPRYLSPFILRCNSGCQVCLSFCFPAYTNLGCDPAWTEVPKEALNIYIDCGGQTWSRDSKAASSTAVKIPVISTQPNVFPEYLTRTVYNISTYAKDFQHRLTASVM